MRRVKFRGCGHSLFGASPLIGVMIRKRPARLQGLHWGSLWFPELSFRRRLSSLRAPFDSAPGHIYPRQRHPLNMIAERLAAAMREPDFPPLVYGGLKREELHRVGSVILHEIYFANLGGDGKAGGAVLASLRVAHET